MTKHIAIGGIIGVVAIFSAASGLADSKSPPPTMPAKVADCQKNVEGWLDGLHGMTAAEVTKSLGDNCERTTWSSGDEKGLKLIYSFDGRTTLDLLFVGDHVGYIDFSISAGG